MIHENNSMFLSEGKEDPHRARLRKTLEDSPINWSRVILSLGAIDQADAITKILSAPQYEIPRIEGFFDLELYLDLCPHVRESEVNPIEHFLFHGRKNGRTGWFDLNRHITNGGICFNDSLSTVVIVTHEASATGAPVVALEVAKRLSQHYNVITVALGDGDLLSQFVKTSVCLIGGVPRNSSVVMVRMLERLVEIYPIKVVLLNSVVTLPLLEIVSNFGLPTVSLIHEYAEYTLPIGKMSRALMASDIVVYPASSLKDSGLSEFYEKTGARLAPSHIFVQPQGYLGFIGNDNCAYDWSLRKHLKLTDDAIVISGAGHINHRKGVDWFLQTCYYLKKILAERGDYRKEKLQFVWLGTGFEDNDLHVSVWLKAFINKTDIGPQCHFPGAVNDVSKALLDADIFLLSSRLDPFPNVAVDALNADCSLAVFKGASGIAEFVREHNGRFVEAPYGDCYALAESVVNSLDSLMIRDGVNHDICEKHLSFDRYISNINSYLQRAAKQKNEIEEVLEHSQIFKQRFDVGFYRLGANECNRARHFLSLLYKGLIFSKPFPGSDAKSAVESQPFKYGDSFINYVEWLMKREDCSMPVTVLKGTECEPYVGTIAVHFHVYFNDLIPEFCRYLVTLLELDVDIYISHVDYLSSELFDLIKSCVSGDVYTFKVANEGRNVHPFHRLFVDHIVGRYDVVGHFHTKKSNDNANGVGDRWRCYLLDNLLGSTYTSKQVLSMFNDSATGLVFAEDSHCVDEGVNGPYITSILSQLGSSRQDRYHGFPLGTMFWARSDALEGLTKLNPETFKLPEPVPYDGSVLHAFERVIPQLAQEAGFNVSRVYTPNTFW